MVKKKQKGNRLRTSLMVMIFLTLVFIFISLLYIIVLVINHYEAFEQNPLLFGAKKYNINSCTCFSKGNSFMFDQDKIWQEKTYTGIPIQSINFTLLNDSIFR